jgi:type VI secretion system secreted protein VgrG
MELTTPLGADVLLLEKLTGFEAISELFRLELEALALATQTVGFDALLGQSATIKLSLPDGSSRYLNGIISRVGQGGQVEGILGRVTFTRYRLEVVPKLWLLTRRAQSRIFQQMAVPDILRQVLTGFDVDWQLQGTYDQRDYCVQYQESDFAFVSRMMEEEGIYYFFNHANGSHQMVIADTPQSHPSVPGPETISYQPGQGGLHPDDRIFTWAKRQEITSGKVTLWDHCFELPGQHLEVNKAILGSIQAGTISHSLGVANNSTLEIYEYPGRYAQRFDGVAPGGGDRAGDLQKIFQDNARTANIRMQQETVPALLSEGEGNVRHLSAGHKFTLADHFNANGSHVLTRVEYSANLEGVFTDTKPPDEAFRCRFCCIPEGLPYRPSLVTPRPKIPGPQTAVVVGPAGQEIFTDKYGRVKVQFHWDRLGQNNASSSCWVRVGTLWAGKQWGSIWIPRIGHEVLVAFEDGDPDRPIVVGSVYNAENMPPYTLPDNMTQSGIKSRSTTEGDDTMFNELRFEDKKGSEEIYFHAEKDFNRVVENNDTLKVGFEKKDKGNQTIEIFNSQTVKIGAGAGNAEEGSQTISVYKDRTETIETGNETLTVKKGNRTATIETGNETLTVKKGNRETTIETGNDTLTVKQGNLTIAVSSGKIAVEAAQSIELKVGSSSILINTSSITLKSTTIKVEGTAEVGVKAPKIGLQADGQLEAKGATVAVQGSAQAQVKAPVTQVNGDGMLQLKGGVTMIN